MSVSHKIAAEPPVIRILVVDDSAAVRGMWRRELSKASDMEVVAVADNGKRALAALTLHEIDLILLDIEMPEMDGLTALPLLLQAKPGVRVVMASSLTHQGSRATIQALTCGASDYVGKPSSHSLGASVADISAELLKKIRGLRYPNHSSSIVTNPRFEGLTNEPRKRLSDPKIFVVGSSTGGPNALVSLLKGLGSDFNLPILIVQHMPEFFISALAERLTIDFGRLVSVAKQGDLIQRGSVFVAPGNFHMTVQNGPQGPFISLNQEAPENFCRPAVDPLFRSAASVYSANVIAAVLTGMGEDGRLGSEVIKKNGGIVVAQDMATSVVWGMPGAVVRDGLAEAILPIDKIGSFIKSQVKTGGAA